VTNFLFELLLFHIVVNYVETKGMTSNAKGNSLCYA